MKMFLTVPFVSMSWCFHIGVFSLLRVIWLEKRSKIRVGLVPLNMLKPSNDFFGLSVPKRCFFCGSALLIMFYISLCHALLSVLCSLEITCCERADLLVLL